MITPVPDLLLRLDALARERHTERDILLSEAISSYLEREEARAQEARINDAYSDDPAANREEASLARSRQQLRCRLPRE